MMSKEIFLLFTVSILARNTLTLKTPQPHKCELEIGAKESSAVSTRSKYGDSRFSCYNEIVRGSTEAVLYCPNERFCGTGIKPNRLPVGGGSTLEELTEHGCQLVTSSKEVCIDLISELMDADYNECRERPPNCPVCLNFIGGFDCRCPTGYEQEGSDGCADIDECLDYECPELYKCANTPGSFQCDCIDGYSFNRQQVCVDIDECEMKTDNCARYASCYNTPGLYECECRSGFTGNGFECKDVNECTNETICRGELKCFNKRGSYRCMCRFGYKANRTDYTCNDVDECEMGMCGDHSNCTNSIGSFECECYDGFQAEEQIRTIKGGSDDGSDKNETISVCVDTDECLGAHVHPCKNLSFTCENNEGSFSCEFIGDCQVGFHRYVSDGACEDIDECVLHNDCDEPSLCVNKSGGYYCRIP